MGSILLLLLPLLETLRKAYYYYYYFPDYYYYHYYYFPITVTFIITMEPKKHNTSRLQSNIQRPLSLPCYHTLP